jgi:hypothetical protein
VNMHNKNYLDTRVIEKGKTSYSLEQMEYIAAHVYFSTYGNTQQFLTTDRTPRYCDASTPYFSLVSRTTRDKQNSEIEGA